MERFTGDVRHSQPRYSVITCAAERVTVIV